jgi:uncharacterized membrane protein
MTIKKILGTVLTILGCVVLIYAASLFLADNITNWKELIVSFVLGVIFFSSGIGLIKHTDG